MKINQKTIRLLSSILAIPILSFLSWSAVNQPEDPTEENLIAEYSQKEKETTSESTEEAQQQEEETEQKSNDETKETTEKIEQESSSESTEKNTAQEKQSSTQSETTNKSDSPTTISSTSTAQTNTSESAQTTSEQSTDQSSYISEVVKLCNNARQAAGVTALLNQNSKLQQAADIRAGEIKQNFSHTRPNGTTAYTVLDEVGISYTTWGENIAYGQKTPQEVFNAWMSSPGHKANILNANFKEIAVGMNNYYWVQIFI